MLCGEIISVCSQIHKKTHNLTYIYKDLVRTAQ